MQAKYIMTRDVITVSPSLPVKELAMLLIKNQVSGVPVADETGKIIGLVSEADIIAKANRFNRSCRSMCSAFPNQHRLKRSHG